MSVCVPIKHYKDTAAFARTVESSNEPVMVTKPGQAAFVSMSMEVYEGKLFLPESGHPFAEVGFADLVQLAPFPDRHSGIQAPLYAAGPHAPSLRVVHRRHLQIECVREQSWGNEAKLLRRASFDAHRYLTLGTSPPITVCARCSRMC